MRTISAAECDAFLTELLARTPGLPDGVVRVLTAAWRQMGDPGETLLEFLTRNRALKPNARFLVRAMIAGRVAADDAGPLLWRYGPAESDRPAPVPGAAGRMGRVFA